MKKIDQCLYFFISNKLKLKKTHTQLVLKMWYCFSLQMLLNLHGNKTSTTFKKICIILVNKSTSHYKG